MQYLVKINQIVTQEQYDALQQIGLLPFKSVAEEKISIDDLDEIIKSIIDSYLDVGYEPYLNNDRKMANATARFFRSAYLYKYTNMTLSECAEYCGYNDHTSIIYSREQVDKLADLGTTSSVYRKYTNLAKELDTTLRDHLSQKELIKAKGVPKIKFKEQEYEVII